MNSSNNIRLFLLGAFLAAVAADAPYAPALPAPIYGPPKVALPLAPYPAPIPAPVYGVPKVQLPPPQIITSYGYNLINPPKPLKVYAPLAPYPAPLAPYPAPLAPYPAPAPIIKVGPYPAPIAPAPVYGVPKVHYIKPVAPVLSSYGYTIPHYVPKVLQPYPAPAPIYGPPKIEVPVLPAPVYGVPAPAPVAPHSVYGAPQL